MSDKIKSSDIIDDELFVKVSQNGEAFLKTVKEITEGLKENLIASQRVMATTIFSDSASIEKYTKEAEKAEKIKAIILKGDILAEKVKQESIKTQAAQNKETEKAVKLQEKAAKESQKAAKTQAALTSEYKQATAALNAMEKELLDNAIAGRSNTEENKKLVESHKLLKAQIVSAEEAIGRFHRNVGNYKSGFNGLSNSVNQLTRELPAFANSVQTGFMAISNNLPIFFDEISKARKSIDELRAAGEKAPSMFATLTGSVVSWGTVLSLAITALTVYGKDLVEFIGNLSKAGDAFELSSKAQSAYYENLTKIIEKRMDAQLKLNVLNKTMTDAEAKNFKADYDKKKDQREIEKQFYEGRVEIAKKFGVDLAKVNGKISQSDFLVTDFKRVEKVKQINDAYIKLEEDKNYALLQLDNQYETEKKVNNKEQANKDKTTGETAEKKAAALEKKRREEGRQAEKEYDEKWKKEREKLNNWIFESDKDRKEWELQNIKTTSDAEIDASNATTNAIIKIQTKKKKKLGEMTAEEKKEYFDKLAAEAKQQLEIALSFIDQLNRIKAERQDKEYSLETDKRQRNIQQQQQLAAQGLDNTLVYEKEALAKAELERQQQVRKREKDAKILAFLKLISTYADKNDEQAVTKAFLQMAIATALTGSFAEGVENLEGPGTETSDSILARLSKGESVATAKATKNDPGLVTAMNKGKVDEYFEKEYLPKYMTSQDVGSFAENAVQSLMLQQLTAFNKKIDSIEKIIKERPVHQTDLTPLGDIVDTRIANGMKRVTTKKNNSPLNWI